MAHFMCHSSSTQGKYYLPLQSEVVNAQCSGFLSGILKQEHSHKTRKNTYSNEINQLMMK